MRIMSTQHYACTRNMKISESLRERGHTVDLHHWASRNRVIKTNGGYAVVAPNSNLPLKRAFRQDQDAFFTDRDEAIFEGLIIEREHCAKYFDRVLFCPDWHAIYRRAKLYDVIMCHNAPSTYTVAACVAEQRPPVVAVWHDYYKYQAPQDMLVNPTRAGYWLCQGAATELTDAHIWVSQPQFDYAVDTYPWMFPKPTMFLGNYASRRHVEEAYRHNIPKLPKDELHVVHMGSLISDEEERGKNVNHYNLARIFTSIADRGVHVHMQCHRPAPAYQLLAMRHKRIHWHDPVKEHEVIRELRKYHAGLCFSNVNETNLEHMKASFPNKLFEYLPAGLPVITQKEMKSISGFVTEHGCGIVTTPQDMPTDTAWLDSMSLPRPDEFTYGGHAEEVETFLQGVIDG